MLIQRVFWHRYLALAVVAFALSGCAARDSVYVQITYAAEPPSAPLQKVSVFVGANKSSWPELKPGDTVSVVLPPDGEPPELTLKYEVEGRAREWRGPPIDLGVGYKINITVAGDGALTERHCATPCDLR